MYKRDCLGVIIIYVKHLTKILCLGGYVWTSIYDSLDTDVGYYDAWWWSHPPMYQEKGLYRPYAKLMKETVG